MPSGKRFVKLHSLWKPSYKLTTLALPRYINSKLNYGDNWRFLNEVQVCRFAQAKWDSNIKRRGSARFGKGRKLLELGGRWIFFVGK